MTYQITVEQHFEAAHFLRGYKGKCEKVHGHRYRVVAHLSAAALNDIGLAYDFSDLKRHLREIIAKFDHELLNDLPPFKNINPSAENIATTIYRELKPKLSGDPVTITAIEVWESPEQGVAYTPD
ncbi:MAG: 6-carboxytetrahydropterin synthase QueD [Dehalococcoidia bacterium]|nr:6-carboxytetrahydropterin synthase QueD [Dehalococcoidia bacterium]